MSDSIKLRVKYGLVIIDPWHIIFKQFYKHRIEQGDNDDLTSDHDSDVKEESTDDESNDSQHSKGYYDRMIMKAYCALNRKDVTIAKLQEKLDNWQAQYAKLQSTVAELHYKLQAAQQEIQKMKQSD